MRGNSKRENREIHEVPSLDGGRAARETPRRYALDARFVEV